MRSAGSGSPITPVEATKTWSTGSASRSAAARAVASTATRPFEPVKALALPELTRMAKPCSPPPSICSAASFSSHQSTGPERVAERVKTPASEAPGAISASITSSRPW